jgi:hypothetical protein
MDLNETLGEIGYGFFKSFLKEKNNNLNKFFIKNKVGFLPPGMDYSVLQNIQNKSAFKQLKFLIGNHQTLSIILTGIYVSSLDKEVKKKILEENRQKIYDKHGPIGVSIMNMGTTGFIEGYISWLSNYNIKNNPSKRELVDLYEDILKDWLEITIFIQGFMDLKTITSKIMNKINIGKKVFFVFACGGVILITKSAIKNMVEKNIFREYNYTFSSSKLHDNDDERVWIIERIEERNIL